MKQSGNNLALFSKEEEVILNNFYHATGLKMNYLHASGKELTSIVHGNCEFCQLILNNEIARERCRRTYFSAAKQAANFKEPYFFRCWAGLVSWAVPVQEDRYLGTFFCGRVLMWKPDDYFWKELEDMLGIIITDFNSLKSAVLKLPVIKGAKIQASAELLWLLVSYFNKTEQNTLEHKKEMRKKEKQLALEIQSRKRLENKIDAITFRAKMQKLRLQEEELLKRFRKLDQDGCLQILQEIIAERFLALGGDLDTLRDYALELAIMLNRTAVERGAESKNLLKDNGQLINKLESLQIPEEIIHWLEGLITSLVETEKEQEDQQENFIINEVMRYLNDNYMRSLSLVDIAKQVYITPAHLSAVFKKEVGLTVMEFLTKIRIKKAQELLRKPEYNVVESARATGYFDPSYFTKVFKRETGISPSDYKQQVLH